MEYNHCQSFLSLPFLPDLLSLYLRFINVDFSNLMWHGIRVKFSQLMCSHCTHNLSLNATLKGQMNSVLDQFYMNQKVLSQLQLCRRPLSQILYLKMRSIPITERKLDLLKSCHDITISCRAWSLLDFVWEPSMTQHEIFMPQHGACWFSAQSLEISEILISV